LSRFRPSARRRGFLCRQLDAGAPRFGQADGDRLLRRSRAVLAFANMPHFFADELTRLSRRGFAFHSVAARATDDFAFRH
jgi:hypothetical protein